MGASNTRFTQNSVGQSKTPIDSDHGIYRYWLRCMSRLMAVRRRIQHVRIPWRVLEGNGTIVA